MHIWPPEGLRPVSKPLARRVRRSKIRSVDICSSPLSLRLGRDQLGFVLGMKEALRALNGEP